MAFATSVAGFATKVATEQAPGVPTVTIYGGECEVCAPYQGSWPADQLEAWPAYHSHCECVADVEGGLPTEKAIEVHTKAAEPVVVNNEIQPPNLYFQIAEGAFKAPVTVEPAQVNVEQPAINVAPAEVTFAKGAIEAPVVNVESAPPADIRFDKGAFAISNPVTVEAPPPADIRFVEGAIQMKAPDVNVEIPKAPDVHLTIEPPDKTTKRVIRDEQGHIKEIVEERKQVVKRDPKTNRIESVEED